MEVFYAVAKEIEKGCESKRTLRQRLLFEACRLIDGARQVPRPTPKPPALAPPTSSRAVITGARPPRTAPAMKRVYDEWDSALAALPPMEVVQAFKRIKPNPSSAVSPAA